MAAIQEMIETHHIIPIPAYDANLRLIIPAQCPHTLTDAVAIVHFSLKHWAIDSIDTYVVDIVNVQVVIPPTLWKCKLAVTDPFNTGSSSSSTLPT
jgi:hypothetical protein